MSCMVCDEPSTIILQTIGNSLNFELCEKHWEEYKNSNEKLNILNILSNDRNNIIRIQSVFSK